MTTSEPYAGIAQVLGRYVVSPTRTLDQVSLWCSDCKANIRTWPAINVGRLISEITYHSVNVHPGEQ